MSAPVAPPAATAAETPARDGALTRFRVMAWVTGVLLLALTAAMFVAYVPALGQDRHWLEIVAPLHGWVYAVYLVVTLQLGLSRRWGLGKLLLVLLAGTVPVMSFVAERHVVRRELG